MECTGYGVQPTVLQTLTEVIIPCTHINTSFLKANEAKSHECGEFEIVPLGLRVVVRVEDSVKQTKEPHISG